MGIKYLWEAVRNYGCLKEENQRLKEEINFKPDVMSKDYWNKKWQQSIVFYSAPKKRGVTEYLAYREIPEITEIAKGLIKVINNLELKSVSEKYDFVPFTVMQWTKNRKFKYAIEKAEKWNSPEETLVAKTVDCDDIAILEYYIIREIFMQLDTWQEQKHRIKCVVGHVHNTGQNFPYAGLHFYLIWLHSNGEFQTVESTFFLERAILNYGNLPHKLNNQYSLICWTFNEQFSWNQTSLNISKLDFKKDKEVT